jgi:hypothetical protein
VDLSRRGMRGTVGCYIFSMKIADFHASPIVVEAEWIFQEEGCVELLGAIFFQWKLLIFASPIVVEAKWIFQEEGCVELLGAIFFQWKSLIFTLCLLWWKPSGSVTANISWYVVSEKWHHFWELPCTNLLGLFKVAGKITFFRF